MVRSQSRRLIWQQKKVYKNSNIFPPLATSNIYKNNRIWDQWDIDTPPPTHTHTHTTLDRIVPTNSMKGFKDIS